MMLLPIKHAENDFDFKNDDFDIEDKERSGWLRAFEDEELGRWSKIHQIQQFKYGNTQNA